MKEKKEIEKREFEVNIFIEKFIKLVKVIVYLYDDYSRKMCFIAQGHFQSEDMNHPVVRSFFKEFFFNSNGQTYEGQWRCVRSKRPTKAKWAHNGKNKFRTVTYWDQLPFMIIDHEEELAEVLIKPLQNRFRNVSDDVLRAIEYFHRCGNRLSRKIGKLNVYATNSEVCNVLWGFATSEDVDDLIFSRVTLPKTKRFKKEFFKNPLRLYAAYSDYRGQFRFLGKHIEDHNYFWSLFEAGKCNNPASFLWQEMFTEMVRRSGPSAVIRKIIAADEETVNDTASMYRHLTNMFDADRINELLTGSFRDIHDRLIPEYNRIRPMIEYGYGKSYNELRAEYHALIRMGALKEVIRTKRDEIIEYLEINASRRVRYSARALSLQTSHSGIDFILPKYTGELEVAGRELHNCVASYKHRLMSGETTIIFMKREDKLVGCIETHDGYVRQAYGPCNGYLEGAADEAFNAWVNQHGLNGGRFID